MIDPGDEAAGERGLMLTRGLARLTPARAHELRERLQALSEEFGDDPDDPEADADAIAYGIVLAVYPMPPTQEPSDD